MGILAWIVLGAIAGFLANMIVGGREGVIGTILLGIVGAVVGGWLAGTFLKLKDPTGINVESIVISVIGAIIVLFVFRAVVGRRRTVTYCDPAVPRSFDVQSRAADRSALTSRAAASAALLPQPVRILVITETLHSTWPPCRVQSLDPRNFVLLSTAPRVGMRCASCAPALGPYADRWPDAVQPTLGMSPPSLLITCAGVGENHS